ncbi:MAG: molybdopterin-dependent oxidoreductase [Verrucomicrobiales bacterium]|jgi:NADH-quinone oxidoreductase subunit G|nr:molybdopterin-dependent oxidoreductase [Verrucomicrobiales bacterium]
MSKTSINPFNHDVMPDNTPLVNVNYNGKWIQVPKGLNVVEVTQSQGEFLPHYCYHEKLSISGNCRMCLFEMGMPKMDASRQPVLDANGKPEIAWMPRPQIGCATNVTEGMGIRTNSPLAVDCRKGVMEFLLINHPLDCPICDQAGECKLQEYASEYGSGESRFVEDKIKKPKHFDLGKNIVIDDERCILCTRCIRFAREVLDDDVLGIVNRGGNNTVTCHPGKHFDNEYSLNTVDLCPVGALTSKDFRFKMRVWFLKETKSICTSCGTGCNVTIGSREQTVYRLTPRHNEEVNSQWMCDTGRLNIHYLSGEDRFTRPLSRVKGELYETSWEDVLRQAGSRLKTFSGKQISLLASGRMTNEELFLTKTLIDELQVSLYDILPRQGQGDKFLRSADLNPNSIGASLLGVSNDGKNLQAIKSGIQSGDIRALLVLQEDATEAGLSVEELSKLELIIYVGLAPNATAKAAHFVLPSAGFTEKHGSMINVKGRVQRLNQAHLPPGRAMDDWEILRDLRSATTGGNGIHTIEDLFRSMSAKVPALAGLTLNKIGDHGVQLSLTAK